MKRKLIVFFIFLLTIFLLFPNNTALAEENQYILGGIPGGFCMTEKGAKVIATCDVLTENGLISPAKDAGILENDVIISIDNTEISDGKELSKIIKNKDSAFFTIRRKNEIITNEIKIVRDINGIYKIGVIIKETPCGIGTITYFYKDTFASLGHPILDDDNNIMQIQKGKVYNAQITGCKTGKRGEAGGLHGIIFKNEEMGRIEKNLMCGVFGKLNENYSIKQKKYVKLSNAQMGKAYIYTTINGTTPEQYEISIVKADGLFTDEKNLVIKITDERLLEKSGGIVQGMSGSPIIQDGKLVGAVTHVFINDPTRGYGIKIQNMTNN